jgi:hypothetical protein
MTDEINAIKIQITDQSLLFRNQIIDPTTNNFQFCLATERCCEMCVRRMTLTKSNLFYNLT